VAGTVGKSRWLLVAAVSIGVTGLVVPPAAAATASLPSAAATKGIVVTMFSDPGDYIGGGSPQEFDKTNASFSGTVSTGGINLSASGGTSGLSWSFVIDPPPGTRFHVGYYPKVQRAEFRVAGYAGLDITGDGRGCSTDSGAIDVRDLAVSGSTVTRLDILYEQHCEGLAPALFGEVRIGEPNTSGLIVSSSSITWPSEPGLGNGSHGTTVPVYLRNAGTTSMSLGAASLQGFAASDFSLAADGCSGTVLAPGGSCDLFLRFRASGRGPQSAVLELPHGGHAAAVQLDALVRPGITSLTMKSQPGDYIGAGQNYNFTSANASFRFVASPSGLEQDVTANDGETWTVDMYPGSGDVLAVGNYPNATRYPFNGTGNGLSVYGDGRGCNTLTGSFRVKQAVFSAVDNSLQNFDGTFIQHCEGATPALTGEVKYDAEAVTTPPPGITNLRAVVSGSSLDITWANPTASRYSYTVVRIEPSGTLAGLSPVAGGAVFAGTGTAASVTGLRTGRTYTVVAYTVDKYGNVSAPVESSVAI
jgi:hypothetical protein